MLTKRLNDIPVTFSKKPPLFSYTTFQLGGECPLLVECETPEQLTAVVHIFKEARQEFLLIGGGSNLVVSDEGVPCPVVRFLSGQTEFSRDGSLVEVSAAARLDALALWAAENSLEGVNYASGIPGTVGGAIAGNAGAFGQQIGDVVETVSLLRRDGTTCALNRDQCDFQYRHSSLRDSDAIILKASLQLRPAEAPPLLKERQEILALRSEKHPDYKSFPCAGSFFKNLPPQTPGAHRTAAGFILEQAGAKAMRVGGAAVFPKHANIIIKENASCTTEDVYRLCGLMARAVQEQSGIELIREVRFAGRIAGNGCPTHVW